MPAPGPARRRRALLRAAPLLAVVLVTSAGSNCNGIVGVDCTLMGCYDQLTVRVTGPLPGDVTVHVRAHNVEATFHCEPGHECIASFLEWTPGHVSVEIDWDGGSFTTQAAPEYDTFYPNGPRCGPACLQGTLVVSLPQT